VGILSGDSIEKRKSVEGAVGYKIVVSPSSCFRTCWDFVLLLPLGSQEQENIVMIREICESILEMDDFYSVYPLTHDDEEDYKNGVSCAVMSFDPNDHSLFDWIVAPKHMVN
jgi:hypothetical protein